MAGLLIGQEAVYWIAPPRSALRHGTQQRPGALVGSSKIKALCGVMITVPLATPFGQDPPSKSVDRRCADCVAVAADLGIDHQQNWDF
jgi:hypothetical protein